MVVILSKISILYLIQFLLDVHKVNGNWSYSNKLFRQHVQKITSRTERHSGSITEM